MKRIAIVLIALLIVQINFAQDKLKGNKNVVTQHRDITTFSSLLVKDNLDVFLSESPNSKVSVETDENLQLAVETRVSDGVLEIYLSQPIARKKKLKIYVGVTDSIQKIEARDNASITGENEIHANDLTIVAQDNASLKLRFRLKSLTATLDDRTDASLGVSAKDNLILDLQHSASLKLTTTCDNLQVSLADSGSIKASGNTKELSIISSDNGSFKGKELLVDKATIQSSDRTDTYINISKKVVVNIENNAELYLYDNPEVIIEKFSDKATLFKK